MPDSETLSKNPAQRGEMPVVALACPDLMFLVRLQGMARAAGYAPRTLRPGDALVGANVLVVNLAGAYEWEPLIRGAVNDGVPVVAFGPHMDAEGRRRAKAAGASRMLANSNLERDLPLILSELRQGWDK